MSRRSLTDRFWAAVVRSDGCWEWQRSRDPYGYGRIQIHPRNSYAHRVSWELHFGPVPDGLWVLHRCDNPPCVNPDHLFLGTNRDNIADRDRKGRQMRAERHYASKLTEDKVREIRDRFRAGEASRAIGLRFGISHQGVLSIVHRRLWRHVA